MRVEPGHPRFESLRIREMLVKGMRDGLVVPEGLLAHGRGEAFDYLLGEKTSKSAEQSIRASAALLLTADDPVVSVNGNAAALVAEEIVKLAAAVPAKLEVNLFHRTLEREKTIERFLRRHGAKAVLGVGENASARLRGVSSRRRRVDPYGIGEADVVLVPMEDGDRATALERAGKRVIAIDLNPLSRTSRAATVTIVDNIMRALPRLFLEVERLKGRDSGYLETIVSAFDNRMNLSRTLKDMDGYLQRWV